MNPDGMTMSHVISDSYDRDVLIYSITCYLGASGEGRLLRRRLRFPPGRFLCGADSSGDCDRGARLRFGFLSFFL